jgi:hypothetical protein
VSFLLINPYPDFTLNHLTVPETLVAMISLGSSFSSTASMLPFSLPLMMSPLVLASPLPGSATEADGGPLLVVAVIVLFSGSLMMVRWSG